MFLERFLTYLKHEKRFSPLTVSSYGQVLKQLGEFLQEDEQDYLSAGHRHIRSWVVDMIDKEIQPRSVSQKLSAARSFYKFLVKEGICANNPVQQVKAPKIPKRLPVVVDETKLSARLDTMQGSGVFEELIDDLIIELLFGTGIRLAELLALREQDVDFISKTIKVTGKRNKQRIIPINTSLENLISLYISEKKKKQFDNNSLNLVVTSKGLPAYAKFIYRRVNNYLAHISSHRKKSPHVLRHTFATALLNKGADINAIKELLGHASLAATQVYTHNSIERLKSVYKQAHPKA